MCIIFSNRNVTVDENPRWSFYVQIKILIIDYENEENCDFIW